MDGHGQDFDHRLESDYVVRSGLGNGYEILLGQKKTSLVGRLISHLACSVSSLGAMMRVSSFCSFCNVYNG